MLFSENIVTRFHILEAQREGCSWGLQMETLSNRPPQAGLAFPTLTWKESLALVLSSSVTGKPGAAGTGLTLPLEILLSLGVYSRRKEWATAALQGCLAFCWCHLVVSAMKALSGSAVDLPRIPVSHCQLPIQPSAMSFFTCAPNPDS